MAEPVVQFEDGTVPFLTWNTSDIEALFAVDDQTSDQITVRGLVSGVAPFSITGWPLAVKALVMVSAAPEVEVMAEVVDGAGVVHDTIVTDR